MHLKTALFGLNFDAFEYSWDETGGATRIGLALLPMVTQYTFQSLQDCELVIIGINFHQCVRKPSLTKLGSMWPNLKHGYTFCVL